MTAATSAASNIDANAVLTQAKSVNSQANRTLKNEKTREQNDLQKAASIFAKAEKIADASNNKAEKIKSNVESQIGQKKTAIDEQVQDVSINNRIVEEQESILSDALKRKQELEDAHPELKNMDFGKIKKNAVKTQKMTKTVTVNPGQSPPADGTKGKGGGAPQQITITEEQQVPVDLGLGEDSSYIQEYFNVCTQITQINSILTPAKANLEKGQVKLSGMAEELKNINSTGVDNLNNLISSTNADLTSKANEINPLIASQNQSKITTEQYSNAASQMSSSASTAASSTNDTSLQQNLRDVADKLTTTSNDLSALSNTNLTHAQTDFPKNISDINNKSTAVASSVDSVINNLRSSYEEYLTNNITPYLRKEGGNAENLALNTDSKSTLTATVTSSGSVDSSITAAVNGIIGGADVEGTLLGVAESAFMSVIDTYTGGFGSQVVGMFKSLFS